MNDEPMMFRSRESRRSLASTLVPLATGAVAFVAYAATAARTITWWEGSQYPLFACTLGVGAPPGSLLLTLLGWLASRVPFAQPAAFRVNLLAGLIAAVTVAMVSRLAIGLATGESRRPSAAALVAGAVAGLTLAFSLSIWTHAVQFTPYSLTAAFTTFILATALAWWRRAEHGAALSWLLLLFLLFGLDFSVHRTNALLLPAALVWVTLRRPRLWLSGRAWLAAVAGLGLGLAFHLLVIPLSLRDPAVDLGEPRNLASFWDFVSLKMHGGGFLFNLLPRHADFVRVQLADYAQFLRQNLAPSGVGRLFGILPTLLVLGGWLVALRRDPRRTLGLLVFFLCASLGAVVYFNLPANYFRGMDRHYLPSLVLLAPLLGVGAAALLDAAARVPGASRRALVPLVGLLLCLAPLDAWLANRHACDLSRVRFADAYSRDVLESLPPRAILLTNGDNDTFPLWHLQLVDHVRSDVTVINLPLLNADWYVPQLRRHVAGLGGLFGGAAPPPVVTVADTAIAIPWGASAPVGLGTGRVPPAVLTLHATGALFGHDLATMEILRLSCARRPVCVACTVSPQMLTWLWPYLRLEGMAYTMVPTSDPAVFDLARLRQVLLEQVSYAGLADTTLTLDEASRSMGGNYLAALLQLAQAQRERGDAAGARATLRFAEARVPPARVGFDAADWRRMTAPIEAPVAAVTRQSK
jgi:hypothetical protein